MHWSRGWVNVSCEPCCVQAPPFVLCGLHGSRECGPGHLGAYTLMGEKNTHIIYKIRGSEIRGASVSSSSRGGPCRQHQSSSIGSGSHLSPGAVGARAQGHLCLASATLGDVLVCVCGKIYTTEIRHLNLFLAIFRCTVQWN